MKELSSSNFDLTNIPTLVAELQQGNKDGLEDFINSKEIFDTLIHFSHYYKDYFRDDRENNCKLCVSIVLRNLEAKLQKASKEFFNNFELIPYFHRSLRNEILAQSEMVKGYYLFEKSDFIDINAVVDILVHSHNEPAIKCLWYLLDTGTRNILSEHSNQYSNAQIKSIIKNEFNRFLTISPLLSTDILESLNLRQETRGYYHRNGMPVDRAHKLNRYLLEDIFNNYIVKLEHKITHTVDLEHAHLHNINSIKSDIRDGIIAQNVIKFLEKYLKEDDLIALRLIYEGWDQRDAAWAAYLHTKLKFNHDRIKDPTKFLCRLHDVEKNTIWWKIRERLSKNQQCLLDRKSEEISSDEIIFFLAPTIDEILRSEVLFTEPDIQNASILTKYLINNEVYNSNEFQLFRINYLVLFDNARKILNKKHPREIYLSRLLKSLYKHALQDKIYPEEVKGNRREHIHR